MSRPGDKRRTGLLPLLACLFMAASACAAESPEPKRELGLLTTLPIYWNATEDLAGLIDQDAPSHWARRLLEEDYELRPLDVLSRESDATPSGLSALDALLLAQPRALAPDENVALDEWVRAGGRVLVFADPLLTEESDFALGDARRPHGAVLLSPILGHWGLRLEFDGSQPPGRHDIEALDGDIPVDMAGRFRLAESGGYRSSCALLAEGLVADCAIGSGRAVLVADAALLDGEAGGTHGAEALGRLIRYAFTDR